MAIMIMIGISHAYYLLINTIDAEFRKALQYRFSREPVPGCLEDVYDGEMYKSHLEFFKHEHNIFIAFNFDGAPKFKSSSMQIWPVQLVINELPPKMRYSIIILFQRDHDMCVCNMHIYSDFYGNCTMHC